MRGVFITFEGPEGSGKSTQIMLLRDYIANIVGRSVVVTREPGGTPLAEKFRQILKHHNDVEPIYSTTETLLFEAGRAQNVNFAIKPALAEGKVVLCDRFTDSTLAYQGFARGGDLEMLKKLNLVALDGLEIDMTILLDLSPEEGFARAAERATTRGQFDRLEAEDLDFHRRVRAGYKAIAQAEPRRVKVFDATLPPEALAEQIRLEVANVL